MRVKKSVLLGFSLSALVLVSEIGHGSEVSAASKSIANAMRASGGTPGKTTALGVTAAVDANAAPGAGKVVIAVDNTYPPMEYMNPKNPSQLIGFDVDLGDALSKYLHKKIVWKPTPWDGILTGLLTKKYDIIMSSMNDRADRRKQIDFVDYMSFGQAIIVKAGNHGKVTKIGDLKGKNVGVQIATTSEEALKKEGGVNIKEYNSFPEAFQDLANGRLDAAVVDEVVARYYLNLQPGKYQIAGKVFDSEPVGVGIRKDETQLEKSIKSAIAKMKADGTYDKIYRYWFGSK